MTDSNKSLSIVPRSIAEALSLSEQLAKASTLSEGLRGNTSNVLAAMLAGQEMGLAPMAALRSIHIIKGKPVLAADAMVAVVLASGKCEYFDRVEESAASVTYETKRVGSPNKRRCTWTIEDAQRAQLVNNDNWRKHPIAMLAARAKSTLARDVYPDILAGCYSDDEVAETQSVQALSFEKRQNNSVPDAEYRELPALGPILDAIAAATEVKQLHDIWREASKSCSQEQLAEIRALSATRKREIQQAQVASEVAA